MSARSITRWVVLGSAVAVLASCGGGGNTVANEENARRAYLGLDRSIDKALDLAMQGYNMASSANIPALQTTGDVAGTLAVTGQVSRGTGASGNSEVRLFTTYAGYRDAVAVNDDATMLAITYDGAQLASNDFAMSLRGIPTGTFTGSLNRSLTMSGDLEGEVTLNVTFAGNLRPTATGGIERAPGTTRIMGTATSSYGTYNIDVTR